MRSPPPLFKRVQARRPGQSPLQSFAHEVGVNQYFLDKIANRYGGNHPSTGLRWDVVKQLLQTLSWLRVHEGLVLPPAPAVPSGAPPAVALAILRDWLITVANDESPKGTEPITATDQDDERELISCSTAAQVWQRSASWWRSKVGMDKPIANYPTAGRKKLFRRTDAERIAKELGIAKRPVRL